MADVESCFAWIPPQTGTSRAALVKAARWTSGDVITVSFMDGDPALQKRVKAVAEEWVAPGLANLTLDFRNAPPTLVRISFKYTGSWSVIGTGCKQVAPDKPTMNFGWLTPASTDEQVRRVVLHEFGHCLGLIHEHQNPAGGIQWNKDAVYKELSGPPNNWSKETIDRNMFEPYQAAETNFTKTDDKSIMMYPIPKAWTFDGFTVGLNSALSKTDESFIHVEYA